MASIVSQRRVEAASSRRRGPPVLAVHGLAGGAVLLRRPHRSACSRTTASSRSISPPLSRLGDDSPLALRHRPQHRRHRRDYSMESWIGDLGELVAKHIDKPVVLVGHSMGTIVALKAWAAWPRVHPRAGLRRRTAEGRGRSSANGSPTGSSPRGCNGSDWLRRAGLAGRVLGADDAREAGSRRARSNASTSRTPSRPTTVLPDSARRERRRCAATISVPCIGITGDEDQYAPPDTVAAFLDRSLAGEPTRDSGLRPPAVSRGPGPVHIDDQSRSCERARLPRYDYSAAHWHAGARCDDDADAARPNRDSRNSSTGKISPGGSSRTLTPSRSKTARSSPTRRAARPRVLRRPVPQSQLPELRSEGRRDGAQQLERRLLHPDRVRGEGLPWQGLRDPGEQHLHEGQGEDRQSLPRVRRLREPTPKTTSGSPSTSSCKGDTITIKVNDVQVV